MVYRVYVEKKPPFRLEAEALCQDIRSFLRIKSLTGLRVLNRYDLEGVDEALFQRAVQNVFSEPQLDDSCMTLPETKDIAFAVEAQAGQFDQRADSAAQCIQLMAGCERPRVRAAKVYLLEGALSEEELNAVKRYLINPVDSREATLAPFDTLYEAQEIPTGVPTVLGFARMGEDALKEMLSKYALAMDLDDLKFCRQYFLEEGRDPSLTEIRVIDTYWSDHCRHTTFLTEIENAAFEDPAAEAAYKEYLEARAALGRKKPVTLMDIATIGAKILKARGALNDLDESEEINACTVKIRVRVDGADEDWLLLFKNETHNHPTEIEPFGGAATCIGGAIRDPLSGRAYVYQAMRVTGSGDPTRGAEETLPGKLPQKKLTATAAAGYSSYGNQIGLSTGLVDEIYHPGYMAKRLEIGAVIGAAPARNVRRETPKAGDVVILLGGRTGRDGCGGATGSSKSHNLSSLKSCGAEVQKGNAPEERKLQRLFRNPRAAQMILRCNDFGAGGVSVAIGELADGLVIDLNKVKRKYEGLDGTELAISESQERMAVVLNPEDEAEFLRLADEENLEAERVAVVTDDARMRMNWNGKEIVNLSRAFLSSNGAPKRAAARVCAARPLRYEAPANFAAGMNAALSDLNGCSRRGLAERFDSTIGAGSVLMPFGGRRQRTPSQVMAAKIPLLSGQTDDCSVMSWGFDPFRMEESPFRGAYISVVQSLLKLASAGAPWRAAHLTFQEYFERLGADERRWGLPLAALLGALKAQTDLGVAAIGGKDSMSGSFEKLDVPPTLVSFAVTMAKASALLSPEFKRPGDTVYLLEAEADENGLPEAKSLSRVMDETAALGASGRALAAAVPCFGGIAAEIFRMALGNGFGFAFASDFTVSEAFRPRYGAVLLESAEPIPGARPLGQVTKERRFALGEESLSMDALEKVYEDRLEKVFPSRRDAAGEAPALSYAGGVPRKCRVKTAAPRVLIPVFPGTNCEYDSARAFEAAGAKADVFVVNNLTPGGVARCAAEMAKRIKNSQIIFLPGGFSGGDEPDGSGKFITAFFRNPAIRDATMELLKARDGLIGGICNGFQALIKLGLLPYGEIRQTGADDPTLSYNLISRHQSRLVRTRVASNLSPWLSRARVGEIYLAPVSHGEGRFIASEEALRALSAGGQIATQYVDEDGKPSMDIAVNPNGSAWAVEGISSPDGRVFGRMAHAERRGENLYRNVEGEKNFEMFEAAADYFR